MQSVLFSVGVSSAQRSLSQTTNRLNTSLERLSSGMRINSAKDDAAGLQISNRLGSQISGLTVAMTNANNGISMLQTAEGALQEVSNNLQRIRELGLQAANGTLSKSDRKSIQQEVIQRLTEIDRINATTAFGDRKLFDFGQGELVDVTERDLVKGMARSWLYESEKIIKDQLGIEGKSNFLAIDLENLDGKNGTLAFAEFTTGGPSGAVRMAIDMDDFPEGINSNAGAGISLEGVILHEMVHAVMAVNMDMALPSAWFKEGTAELIRGADARVSQDIAATSLAALRTAFIAENGSAAVVSTAGAYSGGYIAMRYMNDIIQPKGLQNLFSELSIGQTFDTALNTASNGRWANEGAFFAELTGGTVFEDYVNDEMNLINVDNGAMGGRDANGGLIREETMQGIGALATGASSFLESFVSGDDDNDRTDFQVGDIGTDHGFDEVRLEKYQSSMSGAGGRAIDLQVGATSFEVVTLTLGSFSTENLGINRINVTDHAQFAVFAADDAIKLVDQQRATMGAVMNRLTTTINNLGSVHENASASQSRIRDTDFAQETATLTREQIIQQAGTSVLAQASQLPSSILNLIT